nr:odorant receptor [Semanotus bifasciatus]
MFRPREIVCLSTTLNILRAYQVFPRKGEELNPGFSFYVKYVIGCLLASVILVGSFLHLVHTVRTKQYNNIDVDLSYVLSMTSGFLLFILFSANTTAASKMYMFLSDFEQFGKPPKFDRYNRFLTKAGKSHFIYLGVIITLFALSSNIFKGAQCRRDNLEYEYKEICGLITNTWLPFEIDYFPVKEIYLCLQCFSIYYVYMLSGSITFMVMESVVHIGIRLDHVRQLFVDALNDTNMEDRRKKFNFAVRYHSRVLELEHGLNTCFSNAMFSHMVLTASIIGCTGFGVMQSGSPNALAVCIGWLNGMSFVCLSGQHLTNKSLEVGLAVYDTKWYDIEPALQRDLSIVLMRCQKAMILRAAGFGVMNHATILASIIQTNEVINAWDRDGRDMVGISLNIVRGETPGADYIVISNIFELGRFI